MHCERAQEFFSDYLERTLDRPMTVALEAHLGSCHSCRDEIETLQTTLLALDVVPEVEPPADGAWRVMAQIRAARAEQIEEQRAKAPSFLDWLRSLSPARAAMGASLATLVVVGSLVFPSIFGQIQQTIFNVPGPRPAVRSSDAKAPEVKVAYKQPTPEGRTVDLTVAPAPGSAASTVRVTGPGVSRVWAMGETALTIPLVIPNGASDAESVVLTVGPDSNTPQFRYLVVFPLKQQPSQSVTLVLENRPVEEALRQLVPYLDKPVVATGAIDGPISLGLDGQSPRRCLDEVAKSLGVQVSVDSDAYRLSPAR